MAAIALSPVGAWRIMTDHIRLKEKIALNRGEREKVENISGVRRKRASQVVYSAVSDETLHQSIPSGTNDRVSLV